MDAEAAARAWIDGWARGWREHDVETIAALYADDAVFRTHPFRDSGRGPDAVRAYLREVFPSEEDVECWFGEPVVGSDRASVEWWGSMVVDGKPTTLAGVSMLRFAPDGRCVDHRECWVEREGRGGPPGGWGS